jgi:hypothetical protein
LALKKKGGNIKKHGQNSSSFRITSLKDLSVIVSHFDNYPLISQKRADYELFKQALYLMKNKKHLTAEGFKEILSLRASMNLGLPEPLKTISFEEKKGDTSLVTRPEVTDKKIKDPN